MAAKFYQRVFGVHEQAAHMLLICPDFTYQITKGLLRGRARIVPSAGCERYYFELTYRVGEFPKITIIDPALRRRAEEEKVPHTYSDDEPCLFRPGVDWDGGDIIAFTVIPWLAAWLVYYEMWHATGKWFGGGEHPVIEAPKEPKAHVEAA
jgi:hypothetical protein